MKAVVLHEYGDASHLKYEEVEDPKAGPGEVVVRLVATSINPVDWKLRSGAMHQFMPLKLPYILGRDIAGTIESTGDGISEGFVTEDRVMALGHRTYAELVVVDAADLALIPDRLDTAEAAVLPVVALTGEQLITLGVQPKHGQTVLIAGAVGGVGRVAVYTAKKAGAKVIAGVRSSQIQEAKELGADQVVAIDDDDELAKLSPLDAVADTVGHETAEKLLRKVKQGGVFSSVLGEPGNAKERADVHYSSIRVKPDAVALRKLAEDYVAGKFKVPIGRRLPLAQAGEGQALAEKGGIGKVLLLV
jgi:NADPH:quinone reductase-like Zn-dependent oxidoreductase